MPQAATAPGPYIHAQATGNVAREQKRVARSHGGYRDVPVEERVSVLEARWDATIPTLATSKDISDLRGEVGELRGELRGEVSELRGEMRNLENRLIRWVVGAGLALLAVLAATFTASTARIDSLATRVDSLAARMEQNTARLDAKIDARFEAVMAELRLIREK